MKKKIRHISAQISFNYALMTHKEDELIQKFIAYEYTMSQLNVRPDEYKSMWNDLYIKFCWDKSYVVLDEGLAQVIFDATKIFLDKGGLGTAENYEILKSYLVYVVDRNKEYSSTLKPTDSRKAFLNMTKKYIQRMYFINLLNVKKTMYIPPGFSR